MAGQSNFHLQKSWQRLFDAWNLTQKIDRISSFLVNERAKGKDIFPQESEVFAALNACPFQKVRVVILGQDPYHGPGQAHGLAFSVRTDQKIPPSLKNIFQEIRDNCGGTVPESGDLTHWAHQGVLLLNAVLTVESGRPGSHRGQGWEELTDVILRRLSAERHGLVFVLWGADAQKKASLIDPKKHLILTAPHPSPLSAYRGFFGCGHFTKINKWLKEHGDKPISWFPA